MFRPLTHPALRWLAGLSLVAFLSAIAPHVHHVESQEPTCIDHHTTQACAGQSEQPTTSHDDSSCLLCHFHKEQTLDAASGSTPSFVFSTYTESCLPLRAENASRHEVKQHGSRAPPAI